MNPQQRFLKRFCASIAGMCAVSPLEFSYDTGTNAITARRVAMVIGRDVLALGPTQIGDVLGISKALVRHHLHEMRKVLLKNKPLRSVVKACKARADREFMVFCEGLGVEGAAE